uniref:Uncharacterized protein n=1 Tax=Cacopsylla melanoneura TaxID=428564 RepID=A0A8D8TC23_9HEMI
MTKSIIFLVSFSVFLLTFTGSVEGFMDCNPFSNTSLVCPESSNNATQVYCCYDVFGNPNCCELVVFLLISGSYFYLLVILLAIIVLPIMYCYLRSCRPDLEFTPVYQVQDPPGYNRFSTIQNNYTRI